MREFGFEKLIVWQESRNLAVKVYELTKEFPEAEKFGLSSQIRRAITSVCANIAEGSTRKSQKDKEHFYRIAYGSLMELLAHLIISTDLNYISNQQQMDLRMDIEKISLKLYKLKNKE